MTHRLLSVYLLVDLVLQPIVYLTSYDYGLYVCVCSLDMRTCYLLKTNFFFNRNSK